VLCVAIGYPLRVGRGFKLYSGRVIALGRLLLAMLFMAAIGIDISQPALAPVETYTLLFGYQAFAAVIAALTWNNWWLDAKLAGPAHAVDVIMFTVLVYLTEGYTSPFFIFSVFVLLSAAIRWGWRETTLTAILVAILYLFAGLVAARTSMDFHFYRFIVRAGQLVIMSLILIWFGIHQWRARMPSSAEELYAEPRLDKSPLETGLSASMLALGASWERSYGPRPGAIPSDSRPETDISPPSRSMTARLAPHHFSMTSGVIAPLAATPTATS